MGADGIPNLICPSCGDGINARDSVVMTAEGWAHKGCGGEPMASLCAKAGHLPRDGRCRWCGETVSSMADQTAPQDILDEIAVIVERMLAVPRIGGESEAQWRRGRAAGIAFKFGMEFRIERRVSR